MIEKDITRTQFPLIHLNGNSGQALLEQYQNAVQAIYKLKEEFGKIEFHSRDYYPLGEEAFPTAQDQRINIVCKMKDVESYLIDHVLNIYAQVNKNK